MGDIRTETNKGKNVTVFPTDDVIVTFKEVLSNGSTTVTKSKSGPKPPLRYKVRQYFEIKTTAEHVAPVAIRIILPCDSTTGTSPKLWRLYNKEKRWEDITKGFSAKFHLITGETDKPLESMFGIT